MRLIDSKSLYQRFLNYQSKHRNRNLDIDEIRIVISDEPTVCDIEQIRDEIESLKIHGTDDVSITNNFAINKVLQIINKYTKGVN